MDLTFPNDYKLKCYSNHFSWTENSGKNKEKSVLVNPFLRFTETTDLFFTLKFCVFRAGVLKIYPMLWEI